MTIGQDSESGNARIGSSLGNGLMSLLMCDQIEPGSTPSYQLCKEIYVLHPIGKKMVDAPIAKAQSQARVISIPDSPEEMCRDQFERTWKKVGSQGADRIIRNAMRLSRVYGLSTVACMQPGLAPKEPIDYPNLWKSADLLRFNVLDPLNTSGSLVMNQDPNAPDFLKVQNVCIAGTTYNPSRCVIMQNEDPIYIDYTSSGFGYTGRSVYQRALLPLKSFIQSMITDDLVTIKAGILVIKEKSPSSFVDNVMQGLFAVKRAIVKIARGGNVIGVGHEDDVVSLDLTNIEGAMSGARKNILENIAVSADMPAIILNSETFAEGFADGTEDAKVVVEYIDDIRIQMNPLYDYFDKIVQYLAWNPEWYKTVQATFPDDWGDVDYNTAFYRFRNSFTATWPSLLREPESELIKKDAVRLEAMIAELTALLPVLDPVNKASLVQWTVSNFNSLKLLFPNPLVIESDLLENYLLQQQNQQEESHDASVEEPKEPAAKKTFGDAAPIRMREMALSQALLALPEKIRPRHLRDKALDRAAS
jgi:Anti-CBASS Acb1-like protein